MARWIWSLVSGPNGYPPPLLMEGEPEASTYRYLEMVAGAEGETLFCKHFSKFKEAQTLGNTAFARMPSGLDGHSHADRVCLCLGELYRCIENCSRPELDLAEAVLAVGDELAAAGWKTPLDAAANSADPFPPAWDGWLVAAAG